MFSADRTICGTLTPDHCQCSKDERNSPASLARFQALARLQFTDPVQIGRGAALIVPNRVGDELLSAVARPEHDSPLRQAAPAAGKTPPHSLLPGLGPPGGIQA